MMAIGNDHSKRESDKDQSSGVWIIASHINHSCFGDCRHSFIGNMPIIRAIPVLSANTEPVFPYVTLPAEDIEYSARQKAIQKKLTKKWKI